ncbi:hypothetical protein [Methanobrevibacter sp.]
MSFTPQISNPNNNSTPATEIQLSDRLITNKELKDFFVELPKRLELVEESEDTIMNLEITNVINDVNKMKNDLENLKPDVENINERLTELDETMGEKQISGSVQYRLNEIWTTIFDQGGLIEFITDVQDDYLDVKNNVIPDLQSDVNYNGTRLNSQAETMYEIEKDVTDVKNKLTQIDVNTAEMNVIKAQIASMTAQIEQIRTECNNKLATCFNAIEALDDQFQLLKKAVANLQ